jgi:hypothetical protein
MTCRELRPSASPSQSNPGFPESDFFLKLAFFSRDLLGPFCVVVRIWARSRIKPPLPAGHSSGSAFLKFLSESHCSKWSTLSCAPFRALIGRVLTEIHASQVLCVHVCSVERRRDLPHTGHLGPKNSFTFPTHPQNEICASRGPNFQKKNQPLIAAYGEGTALFSCPLVTVMRRQARGLTGNVLLG